MMDELGLVPIDVCPNAWDVGQKDSKQPKNYDKSDTAGRHTASFISPDARLLERQLLSVPFRRLRRIQGPHVNLQRHCPYHLAGQCLLLHPVPGYGTQDLRNLQCRESSGYSQGLCGEWRGVGITILGNIIIERSNK